MKKQPPKYLRVDYMEEEHIKKHAQKSLEGLARWVRKATAAQYKKETK